MEGKFLSCFNNIWNRLSLNGHFLDFLSQLSSGNGCNANSSYQTHLSSQFLITLAYSKSRRNERFRTRREINIPTKKPLSSAKFQTGASYSNSFCRCPKFLSNCTFLVPQTHLNLTLVRKQ